MAALTLQTMTAEQFWLSPLNGKHCELVGGKVIETAIPGGIHSLVAVDVARHLGKWADSGDHGTVGIRCGFILARDPDLVRATDVYYVAKSRIPASGIPEAFWPLAPDLAVEIISPDETAVEIRGKTLEYLHAGSALVWNVYSRSREVVAFTPDGLSRTFSEKEVLQDEKVLPGFRCAVAELFR